MKDAGRKPSPELERGVAFLCDLHLSNTGCSVNSLVPKAGMSGTIGLRHDRERCSWGLNTSCSTTGRPIDFRSVR